MKVTDSVEILRILNKEVKGKGHFWVIPPDSESGDDYDVSVPDYWAKQEFGKQFTECVDSNGSEYGDFKIVNGKVQFIVDVDYSEYEDSEGNSVTWDERTLLCVVKEVIYCLEQAYDFDAIQIVLESISEAEKEDCDNQ